ncbi:LamG-like jellyroll fold domain-containing protein [Pseudomarimonas salicorniae]|uniref:LamG-like jellyroll fold domain-containing protein n=1 Tax=Pseudomarimonas salicorniae TaxID=2933270 RepID=A0ABT0GJI2_9GAMM|nr:LamG-like jellyroll fold domain-containing protein [Lysobacter sp. CAU 1642]MCK7594180.1 hypothetical protein [Lysobacter sp. CAU 1642]
MCRSLLCLLALLVVSASNPLRANSSSLAVSSIVDRIQVEHAPDLQPPDEISIEAWVRLNSSSGCQTIAGKDFETGYWFGVCNGFLRSYLAGTASEATSSAQVPLNTWVHVAVTYNGTFRYHYVNGNVDLTRFAPPLPLPGNPRPLGIGADGASTRPLPAFNPFDGLISELRIWRVGLTLGEVRDGMLKSQRLPAPGLIAAWSLDGTVEERFGNFESRPASIATFASLPSPPVPHDPLLARPLGVVSTDGLCTENGWASAPGLPSWYATGSDLPANASNPLYTRIGGDAGALHVCIENRRRFADDPVYEVIIDTDGDAASAPATDDLRLMVARVAGLRAQRGSSSGAWQDTAVPSGVSARIDGTEFAESVEFRIPRSALGNARPFGVRVAHRFRNGSIREVGWPPLSNSDQPSSWQPVRINLTPPPSGDGRRPSIAMVANPGGMRPSTWRIEASGNDDVDVELVELLVDNAVVESCEFFGTSDEDGYCSHTGDFPVGPHRAIARVFDHVGQMALSSPRDFVVTVDGEKPALTLEADRQELAPGQSVTLTARASDPSGIREILIRDGLADITGIYQRCTFTEIRSERTCQVTLTPGPLDQFLRFSARAVDFESLTSDTASDVVVLVEAGGLDSDADGLADQIERLLCTDPANPDTDGDGLSDSWEVLGIRFADGSRLVLSDFGVNPCARDVLLQLDYEAGFEEVIDAVDAMRAEYRDKGIHLYAETRVRDRPTAHPVTHFGSWHAAYQQQDGAYYFAPERNWAFRYGYVRHLTGRSFATNRFLDLDGLAGDNGYCRGGDLEGAGCREDFDCPGGGLCRAGCSAGINAGSACSVDADCPNEDGSLARCTQPCEFLDATGRPECRRIVDLPYRVMHELGHALGLGHGGRSGTRNRRVSGGFVFLDNRGDDLNRKPNYQSIMNYQFGAGTVCMKPLPSPVPRGFGPDVIGRQSYALAGLGDLDETGLDERASSAVASALRGVDCSHAEPGSFPVLRFHCRRGDRLNYAYSDGLRTITRREEDGAWDFSPPTQSGSGIDWNCNNIIDSAPVAVDINNDGVLSTQLLGRSEWDAIPNPQGCLDLYLPDCANPEASCYAFSPDYRARLPTLATGLAPLDCRTNFIASGGCPGVPHSRLGSDSCEVLDRDVPRNPMAPGLAALVAKLAPKGDALPGDPDTRSSEESDLPPPPPGFELCDLRDNDGDGEVDEGCADSDGDGLPDLADNCPGIANADQADLDGDGLGDVCQHPAVLNVQAVVDGDRRVSLSWDADGIPRRGYALYRKSLAQPTPRYLGAGYPSSTDGRFEDGQLSPDTYTYSVRAVNLNGAEGAPATLTVEVAGEIRLFANGFE